MPKIRRILIIADFKEDKPEFVHNQHRMWIKGLIRQGVDVYPFSYMNRLFEQSMFLSKKMALRFGKKRCDQLLAEHIRLYRPDVIMFFLMKYLDVETVRQVRQAAPNAILACRDGDPFPLDKPERIAIAKETDMVLLTSAGEWLDAYKKAGVPVCAFMPNICDPDIQYRYKVDPEWHTDLLFTGNVEHKRHERDPLRYDLVNQLATMSNATLYGCFDRPRIDGMDYFYAICGAKIALSINIFHNMRLYHSDRLTNYLSCGAFVLSKRVPDTDLLFEDHKHLRYFDTIDEFFDLSEYYLKNPEERQKIADAGLKRAHSEFNCERIMQKTLEFIDTGGYDAPWSAIL